MIEDEIRDLESARYRALVAADTDRLEELLHVRLAYSHSTGAVETRAELLARVGSGYYSYRSADHVVDRVIIEGSTALVLERMTAWLVVDGAPRSLAARSLAVWIRDGDWKLVAYQPTPLPIDRSD